MKFEAWERLRAAAEEEVMKRDNEERKKAQKEGRAVKVRACVRACVALRCAGGVARRRAAG